MSSHCLCIHWCFVMPVSITALPLCWCLAGEVTEQKGCVVPNVMQRLKKLNKVEGLKAVPAAEELEGAFVVVCAKDILKLIDARFHSCR